MKKTMKIALFALLVLLACTLMLTGCNTDEYDDPTPSQTDSRSTEDNESKHTNAEDSKAESSGKQPHVHNFGEWKTTKIATCTKEGAKERYCSCGEKQTDSISAIAHTEIILEAVEATCTQEGLTEGKKCSACDKVTVKQTKIATKAHTIEIDQAVEATCTQEGLTEGKHCSVCKKTIVAQKTVPIKQHTLVQDAEIKATCTTDGLTSGWHCSVCNYVSNAQTVREKLGHNYKKTIVSPTCTSEGYTTYKCSRCDDFYNDEYTEKREHSLNTYGICTGCNTDFSVDMDERFSNVNLSWREHDYGYYGDGIKATCTATNSTGKQIKYITVYLEYENTVGDVIYSASYKFTGPYSIGQNISLETNVNGNNSYGFWNKVLKAGETITDVNLVQITVEYTDGSIDICK